MAFTHTEETKKKLSERHKGAGNPFFGKRHTPETLRKISAWSREFNSKRQYDISPRRLKEFSETEAAYLAGLIDGEGSIVLRKIQRPQIMVYNCERVVMDWLVEKIGGAYTISHDNGREPNYCWRTSAANDIAYLIKRVRRYLVIKVERADVVMRFLTQKYGGRLHG